MDRKAEETLKHTGGQGVHVRAEEPQRPQFESGCRPLLDVVLSISHVCLILSNYPIKVIIIVIIKLNVLNTADCVAVNVNDALNTLL